MITYDRQYSTFRTDFRPIVARMTGTPIGKMAELSQAGVCVACGGTHPNELQNGRVELCPEDRACFRLVTNRYAGVIKNIVERVRDGKIELEKVIDPTQLSKVGKPWLIPIGIEKFVCETTNKTPEQCETETKHGRCAACGSQHRSRAAGRILLCPDCKNLYVRINRWAVGMVQHVVSEMNSGRFDFTERPKFDFGAAFDKLSRTGMPRKIKAKETVDGEPPKKPVETVDPVLEAMSEEQLAEEAAIQAKTVN